MSRALQFGLVAVVAAVVSVLILPSPSVSQELAFNHVVHEGTTCSVCHSGVERSQQAGFPSAAVCEKCHATGPASIAEADWEALLTRGSAFWRPVTDMPDHVMFSHRRHVVLAELDCTSCHAGIGQRATPPLRPPILLDMDTCLTCHQNEGASEDCSGCHR
jgi:hypothetical protein